MYHLFMGSCYYPQGGMRDYVGVFASIEDAKRFVTKYNDPESYPFDYEGSWYGGDWAIIAIQVDGKLVTILEYGWIPGKNDYGDDSCLVWEKVG